MKRTGSICLLGIALSLSLVVSVRADERGAIRAAISAEGARWVEGETAVSGLSLDMKRRLTGLIKPKAAEAERLTPLKLEPPATGLPPSIDWRSRPGGSFVTPVRNQRSCGSCWAFATAAALESATLRGMSKPNSDLNLAEQVLLSCGKSGSCQGGYIDAASNYIRDTGLPIESCYSYTATDGNCANACADWQPSAEKIYAWSWVVIQNSSSSNSIKIALDKYGPLTSTMEVYDDFYYYTGGVYSKVTGTYIGGHAILIVGYDDANQCFICKNSWGESWGEKGYFRIAYSQADNAVLFGDWTIAYTKSPPLTPPGNLTIIQ